MSGYNDVMASARMGRMIPELEPSSQEALVNGLLRALGVFRGVALLWALIGVILSDEHLERPIWAIVLLAAMAIATLVLTPFPGRQPLAGSARTATIMAELALGVVVLVGDGLVYADTRPQSLAWSWPAAGVMSAGIVWGTRAGLIAALITSSASLFAEVVLLGRDSGVVGAFSKFGLWIVAGTLAGYVVERLRHAEEQISIARAREQFARELHDGVLQTLAVIQRRSTDDELAALARDQEHDLRSFIAGNADDAHRALEPAMRELASRHERLYPDCVVNVVVAPDIPELGTSEVEAISGAIGEALTNAGKHGNASKITIYAEPTEDSFIDVPSEAETATIFVSVKDDGSGFNPDDVDERIGLRSSIRGRLADAGGHASVSSAPGRGAEVTLWL